MPGKPVFCDNRHGSNAPRHQDAADGNQASRQPCHGTDYKGTILWKTLADRTLAGHSFPKGAVIGSYSCHNGPSGG